MYHLLNPQLVTLGCWENNTWATHTKTLIGNGIVTNTTSCSISTNTFRTFPELLGKVQSTLTTPRLYVTNEDPVVAYYELRALEEIKPSEVMSLDDLITHMKARPRTIDVDTLLHIRQLSSQQKQQKNWYMIVILRLPQLSS